MSDTDKLPPSALIASKGWKSWSTKKKFVILVLVILIIIALGVGLGVGLGLGLNNGGGPGEGSQPTSTSTSAPAPAPTTTPTSNNTAFWKPTAGTTWQIELLYTLNDTSVNVEVYDIDLFNSGADLISSLQKEGRKVICYFSAGSWENWRPDADKFNNSTDLGGTLNGWPNEKWLNISSENVRSIMKTRLDMAKDKGCDGVDPDNVDGYNNEENDLGLTKQDSINYLGFLAAEAHSRNMSIGLKNAGEIIDSVIDNMQWSVNEQCAQFNECDTFSPFTDANKPVFHIEYPKGTDTDNNALVTTAQKNAACNFKGSKNFSTIIKNMNLDNWIQVC